jgi:hypothetical protein
MRIHAIRKMPLSIDEEESRCTEGSPKEATADGGEGKRSRGRFRFFMKTLQNRTQARVANSYQSGTQQIMCKNREEYLMGSETFAGAASSIHVQPAELPKQTRGTYKEKPRGGSRGAMTRSLSGR